MNIQSMFWTLFSVFFLAIIHIETVNNYPKKSAIFYQIFGELVQKEQQTFKTMKSELKAARLRNTIKKQFLRYKRNDDKVNGEEKPPVQDVDYIKECAANIRACIKSEAKGNKIAEALAMHVHANWTLLAVNIQKKLQSQASKRENDLHKKLSLLETSTKVSLTYAKVRNCATRLRTGIETLRLQNVPNHSGDKERQNDFHGKLDLLWLDRRDVLKNIIQQLGSLSTKLTSASNEETDEDLRNQLESAIKRFKDLGISPPDMRKIGGCLDLIPRLMYFNGIDDLTNDQWKEWKERQASFWRERTVLWSKEKIFQDVDYKTAEVLTKHMSLDSKSYNSSALYLFIRKKEEEDYLNTVIKKIINHEDLSDQYKECLWVAFVWPKSHFRSNVINGIRNDPERSKFWDELDDSEMIDEFCKIDQLIYNSMTGNYFYKQGPQVPEFCQVCPDGDRRAYVQTFSRNDKLKFDVGCAFIQMFWQ